MEQFITQVGMLAAQVPSTRVKDAQVDQILSILKSHQALITRITQEPTTDGFGAMITKLQTYFENISAK